MNFKAECKCTAIGSFPHTDAGSALDDIFTWLSEIPVWPQLPSRDYVEGMCPQYSEALPSVELSRENKTIHVDTGPLLPLHMERFYEMYLSEESAPFAVSKEFAPGLYEFSRRVAGRSNLVAVKGHTTGPITWGLTVSDAGKKAAYYNDMLRDGIVKGLARKAEWQARFLSSLCSNVIIFIDEPYLQSYGAATVPILEGDVLSSLGEVIEGIRKAGASSGVHCCGNTDWSLMCRTGADIINFDAFKYAESLSLYAGEVGDFLQRGGVLAWGIVPSDSAIDSHDLNSITAAFKIAVQHLTSKGIKESLILENALITPSCGAGSLTIDQCRKMLELTRKLSDSLRGV